MTPKAGRWILYGARITAEASWILALAGWLLFAAVKRPFPLLSGLAVFLSAAVVTHATRDRGWRRITLLAIHGGGMLASLGLICLVGEGAGACLFGLVTEEPSLSPLEQGMAWVGFLLTGGWTMALWLRGSALARRPATHESVCSQFDLGVAGFGLVFLVGALARMRWGVDLTWDPALPLFGLFFCAGALAMGLAGPDGHGGVVRLPSQGVWALTAFSLGILGAVAGVVLFGMPALHQGTQLAFHALKETTSPLGPVLVRCLRFLLTHRRTPPDSGPSASGREDHALHRGEPEAEIGFLEEVLGWGLTGLLAAVLGTMLVALAFFGLKALLARSGTRTPRRTCRFSFVARIREWIRGLCGLSIRRLLRGFRDPGPIRLYGRLAAWGRRSSVPHRANETPSEYGCRLSGVFSPLSRDIERIVGLVNQEVYGGTSPDRKERREGQHAWQRLRSPRYWPVRAWVWVRGGKAGTEA